MRENGGIDWATEPRDMAAARRGRYALALRSAHPTCSAAGQTSVPYVNFGSTIWVVALVMSSQIPRKD